MTAKAARASARGWRRALTIAIAAAGLLAVLAASDARAADKPDGLEVSGQFAGAPVPDAAGRRAAGFWTPERIARAKPLDGDGEVELGADRPSPLAAPSPAPLKSVQVNPIGYPNRVHGKIFFQLPSGIYSCSGTIVTSASGSLVSTAGHCAYDHATNAVAANMIFIPGFSAYGGPYSIWPVTNIILSKRWVKKRNAYDDDFAMVRVQPIYGTIQNLGSRGIGFNQPRRQHYQSYGYPAEGRPSYDGNLLIRCDSGYRRELRGYGGPRGIGMKCDSQAGASGGGWVSQRSFIVSNTSHGYPSYSDNLLFGPYFGSKVKQMYKANNAFWPSIGPIRCGGEVASIIGSGAKDKIRGTNGRDVIATVGGRDKINGRGGRDVICGGPGNDKIKGGGGKDKIEGGDGRDKCGRKRGDKHHGCE